MQTYEWSFFSTWDDQTLIPLNLTAQEMALLRSVINQMDDVNAWSDSFDFYNDVVPLIETINTIIADD
jgi:hypothetical protein